MGTSWEIASSQSKGKTVYKNDPPLTFAKLGALCIGDLFSFSFFVLSMPNFEKHGIFGTLTHDIFSVDLV